MERDIDLFNKVIADDKATQLQSFRNRKAKAIWNARRHDDPTKRSEALKDAMKLKYAYMPQRVAINYGQCIKFDKRVSFLPNTLQLDTQDCFVHRKQELIK